MQPFGAALLVMALGLTGCNLIDPPYTVGISYHNTVPGYAPPTVQLYLNGRLRTTLTPVADLGGSTDAGVVTRIGATDQVCLMVEGTTFGYKYTSAPNRSMYGFGILANGSTVVSFERLNDNLNEVRTVSECP